MSIGEVLTQVRRDFPDVTISKIRFLEAEGLLRPERTTAGYRKFSREHVARLRYVLVAQRDRYLPLRVIREHLEEVDRGENVLPGWAYPGGHVAGEGVGGPGAGAPSAVAGAAGVGAPSAVAGAAGVGAPSAIAGAAGGAGNAGGAGGAGNAGGAPAVAARGAAGGPGPAEPAGLHAVADARGGRIGQTAGAGQPTGAGQAKVGRGRVSRADVCRESGLSDRQLRELEQYGLLSGGAGGAYFDAEVLPIAGIIADLSRFGLQARHLRAFKAAADREVGLLEQVAAPLARQRDSEARAKSAEDVRELVSLSLRLHVALVKAGLRSLSHSRGQDSPQ